MNNKKETIEILADYNDLNLKEEVITRHEEYYDYCDPLDSKKTTIHMKDRDYLFEYGVFEERNALYHQIKILDKTFDTIKKMRDEKKTSDNDKILINEILGTITNLTNDVVNVLGSTYVKIKKG